MQAILSFLLLLSQLSCVVTGLLLTVPPVSPRKPLKVLVLHGFHSNGRSLSVYLNRFVDECQPFAKFTFLDAPHIVPALDNEKGNESNGRKKRRNSKFSWLSDNGEFDSSLSFLRQIEVELGPFDVCIGHSQGACVLAAIHALEVKLFKNLKLSIFLSV